MRSNDSAKNLTAEAEDVASPVQRLLHGAVLVSGGTFLGYLIVLAATPALTRLYSPSSFGLLGLYTGVLSMVLSGATLRYEAAVPVAETDGEAVSLVWLSLGAVASVAVLAGMCSAVLALTDHFGVTVAVRPIVLLALPIGILGGGAYLALSSYAIRRRAYSWVSGTKVYQGAANAGVQLALGMFGIPAGLVWGDLAGRTAGVGALIRLFREHRPRGVPELAELQRLARKYRRYPVLLLPAAVCGMAAVQVPIVALPLIFGASAGGAYFLAHRLLVVPGSLISAGVAQVFLGEGSRLPPGERLHSLTVRATEVLFLVNTPFYVVLASGGPKWFGLILGSEWTRAGVYAAVMAPMVLVWSVANPLSRLTVISNKLGDGLAFAALDVGVKLTAIGVGIWRDSILAAVIALTILGGMLALWSLLRFGRMAGVSVREMLQASLRGAVVPATVVAIAAVLGASSPIAVHVMLTGVALCIGVLFGWTRIRSALRN